MPKMVMVDASLETTEERLREVAGYYWYSAPALQRMGFKVTKDKFGNYLIEGLEKKELILWRAYNLKENGELEL